MLLYRYCCCTVSYVDFISQLAHALQGTIWKLWVSTGTPVPCKITAWFNCWGGSRGTWIPRDLWHMTNYIVHCCHTKDVPNQDILYKDPFVLTEVWSCSISLTSPWIWHCITSALPCRYNYLCVPGHTFLSNPSAHIPWLEQVSGRTCWGSAWKCQWMDPLVRSTWMPGAARIEREQGRWKHGL